ncbi:hypothetical protein NIES2100_21830 [Calothrix sp. NIES-2100]|uniref:hypothetical protein n=1 Tax=Calothrix sp. NIES-2100 TaxID=1954172 RepID=UPI000B5F6566|nr:hypothetical protein NIES2100_21830 [Calothrix sp. NIES-2100]
MTITVEKNQLNNQSILQNFAFGEEIDEQAAEIISGGTEKFRIKNTTSQAISYTMDGVECVIQPGQEQRIVTDMGGIVKFDRDTRDKQVRAKGYDLSDSEQYEFQVAPYNSNRINLYWV